MRRLLCVAAALVSLTTPAWAYIDAEWNACTPTYHVIES